MIQKTKFIKLLQLWGIIFIIGIVGSLTSLDILNSYHDFTLHSKKMREDYITFQKQLIKQEVMRVVDLISYERSQTEMVTRARIQARVNEAYVIAQNIYQHNKDGEDDNEIKSMIIEVLRGIRFENGTGYYFITALDGEEKLFTDKPEIEGRNILEWQDSRGVYVIRDMISIVNESGQGFYEYQWTKPTQKGNDFKKISFVKLFEPYDWFIGTGLYVDDIENQIEEQLLATISRIRFGKDGYLFVNRLNGDALVANGNTITGSKKLWDVFAKNPQKTKELFAQEYNAALKPNGDYIYYSLVKLTSPNVESPKASFIYGLPDLEWLIGAGVYLDVVELDIVLLQAELKTQIKIKVVFSLFFGLGILCCFLFLFRRLSHRLENDFNLFLAFINQVSHSDEPIDRSGVQFAELDQIAKQANLMLADKVHAQKQLEAEREALLESELKFRRIVENITDVYYEIGLDGTIYYCSPSCLDFSGYSQDQLVGQNATILYSDPNDRNLLLDALKKDGRVRDLELIFKHENGVLYDVSFNADLALDETGRPTHMTGTIRDITKTKKEKKQVHRSKKMEAIGLMAGGVAHDLNNILSGIVGYPELLLMTLPEDSELRQPIMAIQESGQRAATVVADLLTVARGAASGRENHNVNRLISEHVDSPECIKIRSLYPEITFHNDLQAARPTISCSSVHVKKCLMNLVINAAESMADGGTVSITTCNEVIEQVLAVEYKIKEGEYVVIGVRDTGSGILTTDLEHIFEPFYTKKKMGRSGTGLGLAVVWNTMEDHHGTVLVESDDQGTFFQLYFPSSRETELRPTDEVKVTFTAGSGHILIVDDEAVLRDLGTQMLQTLGYTVDTVSSGELAIEFVQQKPVDLLVLDMMMGSGISGLETYREILKFYPEQRAIVASGFSESDDVKETLRLGASGFIKKPYSLEELRLVVKKALKS